MVAASMISMSGGVVEIFGGPLQHEIKSKAEGWQKAEHLEGLHCPKIGWLSKRLPQVTCDAFLRVACVAAAIAGVINLNVTRAVPCSWAVAEALV